MTGMQWDVYKRIFERELERERRRLEMMGAMPTKSCRHEKVYSGVVNYTKSDQTTRYSWICKSCGTKGQEALPTTPAADPEVYYQLCDAFHPEPPRAA